MQKMFETIIGRDYPKKVIPLINEAKTSIDIVVYDWRWYPNQPAHAVQQFNIAIVKAVKRGVQVRAVLNTPLILPTLQKVGIKARCLNDKRTVHTKLLIIDREIVVMGSHNFTRNAFGSNIETSLAVGIPGGHTRLFEFFNNLYQI